MGLYPQNVPILFCLRIRLSVLQWLFLAFMASNKTDKAQTTKYQVFINQTQSDPEPELGVPETVDACQGVHLVSATHFLSQKKEHK